MIESDAVTLSTRIAAIILLLYGVPVGTIAGLRVDSINSSPAATTIRLGKQPAPIPIPLIPLFTDYQANRANTETMNKNSVWLFPSTNAGQHITPNTLLIRFRIFGIHALGARNATLADLTKELDPTSLAALLGYSPKILTQHAARAGATMGSYPVTIGIPRSTTERAP